MTAKLPRQSKPNIRNFVLHHRNLGWETFFNWHGRDIQGIISHDLIAVWPEFEHGKTTAEEYASKIANLTNTLDGQICEWRSIAESAAELKKIRDTVKESATRIISRYRQIEEDTLSITGSSAEDVLRDSISVTFRFAREKTGGRISFESKILGGKPYFKGTRITVSTVLEHASGGHTTKKILKSFPALTKDDVNSAFRFASEVSKASSVG